MKFSALGAKPPNIESPALGPLIVVGDKAGLCDLFFHVLSNTSDQQSPTTCKHQLCLPPDQKPHFSRVLTPRIPDLGYTAPMVRAMINQHANQKIVKYTTSIPNIIFATCSQWSSSTRNLLRQDVLVKKRTTYPLQD